MKTLLILGGGTGGTMVANKMAQKLDHEQWRIVLVDRDQTHFYQPGFVLIPFGIYQPEDVVKPKRNFLPSSVEVVFSDIDAIEPERSRVRLSKGPQIIDYDILVIATGCEIRPDQIEGLVDGSWRKNIFDFYTLEGASALGSFLDKWKGGRLVVNVAEMPIKCPVAPVEFLFLADCYFKRKGMRDKVDLVYSTPLSHIFPEPKAAIYLANLFHKKGIHIEADFNINSVYGARQKIASWEGGTLDYDLLVSIPTNMGVEAIERSNMGDDLNYVPTDKYTLQSQDWENVWVIGDAGDLPAAKSGSAAHYMLESLVENILRQMRQMPPKPSFDGHASFFVETGFNRGVMLDYNYEIGALPGSYPVPGLGPFRLLKESKSNHLGKMGSRWLYWNRQLPAKSGLGTSQLSLAGKSFNRV